MPGLSRRKNAAPSISGRETGSVAGLFGGQVGAASIGLWVVPTGGTSSLSLKTSDLLNIDLERRSSAVRHPGGCLKAPITDSSSRALSSSPCVSCSRKSDCDVSSTLKPTQSHTSNNLPSRRSSQGRMRQPTIRKGRPWIGYQGEHGDQSGLRRVRSRPSPYKRWRPATGRDGAARISASATCRLGSGRRSGRRAVIRSPSSGTQAGSGPPDLRSMAHCPHG